MAYGQKASSCDPFILLEFTMIGRSSIDWARLTSNWYKEWALGFSALASSNFRKISFLKIFNFKSTLIL